MLTNEGIQKGSQRAIEAIKEAESKRGTALSDKDKMEIVAGWIHYFSIDWKAVEERRYIY